MPDSRVEASLIAGLSWLTGRCDSVVMLVTATSLSAGFVLFSDSPGGGVDSVTSWGSVKTDNSKTPQSGHPLEMATVFQFVFPMSV